MMSIFTKLRKITILAFVGILVVSVFSGSAYAVDDKEKNKESRVIKLSPQADNFVNLGELEVVLTNDGARFSMSGKGKPGDKPSEAFELSFDLENNSYKTEKIVEPQKLEKINPEYTKATEMKSQPARASSSVGLTLKTSDPAGVVLCETWQCMYYDYNGTSVSNVSRNGGDWAANPSSLGTHWYKYGLTWGPLEVYSWYARSNLKGEYYNYDFLNDDEITEVTHDITLKAYYDGSCEWFWLWEYSGEAWQLLRLSVVPWQ